MCRLTTTTVWNQRTRPGTCRVTVTHNHVALDLGRCQRIFRPAMGGYVLENSVTHARLLPVDCQHAFTYPTYCLLTSLNALENHSLDLAKGWIFGYGGRWGRLFGLRPHPYLSPGKGSIKQKLLYILKERGFEGIEDAWMMTMPNLLGFEGINPLTVYFCYDVNDELLVTVLEVHNTFGENHVYCLKTGEQEDKEPSKGFDHQWTFPRAFHVSPFNDRRGFYTVSIRRPTHAPSRPSKDLPAPRPSVRVHLLTPTGALKLTALLRPTTAYPLTSSNLLWVLSKYPFDLFLSFARIVYHAWVLHYQKRLDVFIRPEPIPALWRRTEHNAGPNLPQLTGGVRWLPEGVFERYARVQLEIFLRQRTKETNISVVVLPGDSSIGPSTFSSVKDRDTATLKITLLSSRAYTLIFLAPSAKHALLLGRGERVFNVSDDELFVSIFSPPSQSHVLSRRQQLRQHSAAGNGATMAELPLKIPFSHPLDMNSSSALVSTAVICILLLLDGLEALVFRAVGARPVPGTEPWGMWKRAVRVHGLAGEELEMVPDYAEGSLRHLGTVS
ncbi:hypothetical protein MIND_00958500 [Mycena indigotica]|uniref:Uncharacterized protein n=1 Tax=Mycena indigotica TaxID=2126181 RepID=A0A8H6VX26_9AGAR|nr:uncharacterized protein MIND_00958500 [Mycena indigotica]KAF7297254.1 hypothetical protein MIND_00958500 [Mycena indigotica]